MRGGARKLGTGGGAFRIVVLDLWCPDLTSEEGVRWYRQKLSRDLPWVLHDDGVRVESWGLRRAAGASQDPKIRARGPCFPLGLPTWLALLSSWMVHAALATRVGSATALVAPTPYMGLGAVLAKQVSERPLVVRVMGNLPSKLARVRGRRRTGSLLASLESWVLRRAQLVLPMGEFTRRLAEEAGVPPERIVELPFPTSWHGTSEPSPVEGRGPVVVCAARLVPEKGLDVLLRAFVEVRREVAEARLEIAGDGPERRALEALARTLGIGPWVRFLGWVPAMNMPEVYARARVAVLPSVADEGLGMCLVEAGLAGCALVGSDLGGIRDIVRPGRTGLLVPPEDPEALARTIVELLGDPEQAAFFGRGARDEALAYLAKREAALEEVRQRIYELVARG